MQRPTTSGNAPTPREVAPTVSDEDAEAFADAVLGPPITGGHVQRAYAVEVRS